VIYGSSVHPAWSGRGKASGLVPEVGPRSAKSTPRLAQGYRVDFFRTQGGWLAANRSGYPMLRYIRNFLKSEDGPTAVEYAVMLALIIVACLTVIGQLGSAVSGNFSSVSSALQ
jgi:pilus assembly protein Flp/PilA